MNLNKSMVFGLTIVTSVFGMAGLSLADEIRWQSGAEVAGGKTPDQVDAALADLALRPQARHAVVQLAAPVTDAHRAALANHGVTLHGFIGNNAFFATIDSNALNSAWVAGSSLVSDVLEIQRRWRLHPYLASGQLPQWAVPAPAKQAGEAAEDTIVALYVMFHRDVALAPDGVNTLFRHGARLQSKLDSINSAVIEIPFGRIGALADEDVVSWIEPALPKFSELNNSNREITGANAVQLPPYNLDGSGIGVLVYDGGYGRASHVDFGGRLTVRDNSGSSNHSTHVAGTIGGSGQASGGLYRGMAPGVTIEAYGFEQPGGLQAGFLYTDPGDIQADYTEAINVFGVDIASNSIGTNTAPNGFPCEWEGNYSVTSAMIDTIARGGFSGGEPFRIIWANGNERGSGACGSTYHTTAPPACAKNHITVGALNSNDDSMTSFSSWGPCDDGRMKPDLSAPGCQSNDDGEVTSCSNASDTAYTGMCGTSMACPTVAGLSALLLQDYRIQFPGDPDPRNSTLKALLAHTCQDLGNNGPDYQTGYGSVRIQPAIDLMRAGNFLEAAVNQGELFSALVVVNPGETFQATLAWDDPPAAPNVIPILVNDLDLIVIDPQGVQQFPWTLDPNNPSAPATRNQADHVNNIEQVRPAFSQPGTWQIQVLGTNVPDGPQAFSLTASPLLVQCSTIGSTSMDRPLYACDSLATLRVVDCDLNTSDQTVETVDVLITSDSEPAGETVTLIESAPETATFSAAIALSTVDAPGDLLVLDGDQITLTYVDADDGFGNTNVPVHATAFSDCQAPIIFNVTESAVEAFSATITFDTDEPTTGTVSYGIACGVANGSASSGQPDTAHAVQLSGLTENTTYFYWVDAEDPAGNPASDDNGGACYSFATPDIPDYFTEEFGSDNDMDFQMLTFTPNGTGDFYGSCVEAVNALPQSTAGAIPLSLSDDSSNARTLTGGQTVSLYGVPYTTAFVGSNGYVTFTAGDSDWTESLSDHFALPRISALFDDLNPSNGGTIYWQQLADRAVVTYFDVPEFSNTGSNTFQIEMLFDGTIRLTYLAVSASDGIVGLSAGQGIPQGFIELDLTASGPCIPQDAPPTVVQQPVDTS
ncbi:MAG: S8 family serine peptidase, partial [Phycisphaerae bacterium]